MIPTISLGSTVFIIGFTLFVFAMIDSSKLQDDPSNVDIQKAMILKYQAFTALFFMIGSMFFFG